MFTRSTTELQPRELVGLAGLEPATSSLAWNVINTD